MKILAALFLCTLPFCAWSETDGLPDCLRLNPNSEAKKVLTACNDMLGDKREVDVHRRAAALAARRTAPHEFGQLDRSIKYLGASVALFPDTGNMRMLAWSLRTIGRAKEAEELYTQVLETDDHWQGWLSRCVVRQDLEAYAGAARDCDKALAQDTNNLDALFFAARANNFLGRTEKARKLAEKAMGLAPADPRHVVEYVWALHLAGDTSRALQTAKDALKTFPDDPGLLLFIAQ
ncbi:tetratricopeptide repeat protein [Primorskyibacter sp. 2E233]|uniref:tetratricopeptide repeat protein n=1 Tax=Primorskyibacter sp. 2E233 TaxID=3413431 RepID=UPI003BF411EF